ncbi:unnamed protein product [Rotaria magnacalcarata]|uniref:Frizzled-6 n=1 Tax=Rotaria magnacalcarata TaxID=392030 RepID=A0A8S2LEI2_9BILA|nr:unnamed protein product [Rotaria magnacalcarata]
MASSLKTPLKLIIDSDPGIDDYHAITMALSYPNVQLLGITIVTGNTSLVNGVRNIHYLLHALSRKDVPVFRGADRALDGNQKYAPHVHGEDGFGNATKDKRIDLDLLCDEPAPVALVRLARENRGELVIAAIGPLTNIFLAHRLDPEFSRNLKCLYIMGGDCTVPRFNTLSIGIEFNFACDALAASRVLEEFQTTIRIVTFELTCMAAIPFATIDNEILPLARDSNNSKARLFAEVTQYLIDFLKTPKTNRELSSDFNSCDTVCMACVLDESVIEEKRQVYACVEPYGKFAAGHMISDWHDHFKLSALKPCRALCEESRDGCESEMKRFGYPWPLKFRCDEFPTNEPCVSAPTKNHNSELLLSRGIEDLDVSCSDQYRTISNDFNYKFDHKPNCGMPCNHSLFVTTQVDYIRQYVGVLSILCLLSTLFTIMTYSIDLSRYRYPERPILFLSICYFALACAYVGGFVNYYYGSSIVCNPENFSLLRDTRFLVQGTHNRLCVLTFLLIYYFGMASMIWWVILTLTWFLAAGLKWGHEAIESQSAYFHLASWGIPACLSVILISKRSIEGDYLTGVCYTGLTEPNVQLGFIIVPICTLLFVGLCFLLGGFISVFKIRTVMKHEGTKTDKLERFMVRIGAFSVVYIVPQLILIICLFYEQYNYFYWLQTWKHEKYFCSNATHCQLNENRKFRPRYELFMIKYTCMLAIGIISSGWVLNGKTMASWRIFFSRQRRSSGSELL